MANDRETDTPAVSSADTKTDKPWLFKAGGPSGNPAGRPRKGQTIAERVAKADAAVARKALKARDKRLELTNAVGERAWATYLAYNLGLPKQTYVIEHDDAPALAWLEALAQGDETKPLYIEGTARALPAAGDASDITQGE